jgi:hypothetical protein
MRRWLGPAGLYGAVTLALTFPLLPALGSALPHDAGDPVLNTWILWWSTRTVPLSAAWWNAPMFFPTTGAMALSELLVGLLPLTAPIQWLTNNPLAAYNTAFVLSFPLCGLAACALAYEITGRLNVSVVAGAAFAFAPYRMGQLAHVQMLAYYWAPVALLGLHRYVRTGRTLWLAVFAVAWLLQALSNGYALFHLSVLVALWIIWFVRPARSAMPVAIAWILAAVPLVPLALEYRRVHAHLHLVRDINEIKRFSADIAGFFSAPPDVALWGSRLPPVHPETAVFPGISVLAIAAVAGLATLRSRGGPGWQWTPGSVGAAAVAAIAGSVALSTIVIGPWAIGRVLTVTEFHKPFSIAVLAAIMVVAQRPPFRRAWRERSVAAFYLLATIAMYVFALGPAPTAYGRPFLYEPPYAWLMRLPGFDVLRVPARFAMLAVLCQSMLLAIVLARSPMLFRRTIVLAAVGAALLADGWIRLPVQAAPGAAVPQWSGVAAVIELPPGNPAVDFPAIYRSMFHELPIANGYSGFAPPHYLPLVHALRDGQFAALGELAAYGRIGIAIDRSSDRSAEIVAALGRSLRSIEPGPVDAGWATFILPARHPIRKLLGPALEVRGVRANFHAEDLGRLADGSVATAWGSGTDQHGAEEIVLDLGAPAEIGAVVFGMGAYAFGFPRELRIETSPDGIAWSEAWRGPTAVPAVNAALADPHIVPVTIEIPLVSARFVKLRQTGREPGIPWWIAELKLHGPVR